jgi:hypothetical protein
MVSDAGAAAGSSNFTKHAASSPLTTADVSFSVSVSGLAPSTVTITGNGAVEFTNDAVALTVNLPAVVAKLIPGGSASPEVVNAVFSGGTIYLEIPSLASLVGEPWISVALPTKAASAVPAGFTKVASALGDVNAIVHLAQKHHASVASLGTSIIDGVKATGTGIIAALPHKGSTETLTASVWADSSDRLVQGSVTVAGVGKKGTVGLTASVDFTNYGGPVTITAPPPSQVKVIPYSTVAPFLGKLLHHGHHGHGGHHDHGGHAG